MLQGDGGPGKALDQGALDGAQPIGATEITFDIGRQGDRVPWPP